MAKDDLDRTKNGILGDINPLPSGKDHLNSESDLRDSGDEDFTPMEGGSRHDRVKHPGSRDVTEGTTGGTGTETGGTRNYRSGTGATGGDIGNRPE